MVSGWRSSRVTVSRSRPRPPPAAARERSAVGVTADATSAAELARALREVEAELGPVDLLVPFAGGFLARTPVPEISEEEWRRTLDACLTSTFLTCAVFLPWMIERRRGVVLTMSSSIGRIVDEPVTASYAAARGAVVAFTPHLALELGPLGIRANCIAPATVLSERVDAALPQSLRDHLAAISPLGRLGTPDDVARAALFLLSDSAAWLTGVTMDVAGGRIML